MYGSIGRAVLWHAPPLPPHTLVVGMVGATSGCFKRGVKFVKLKTTIALNH